MPINIALSGGWVAVVGHEVTSAAEAKKMADIWRDAAIAHAEMAIRKTLGAVNGAPSTHPVDSPRGRGIPAIAQQANRARRVRRAPARGSVSRPVH